MKLEAKINEGCPFPITYRQTDRGGRDLQLLCPRIVLLSELDHRDRGSSVVVHISRSLNNLTTQLLWVSDLA